jgi:hypothetical protein
VVGGDSGEGNGVFKGVWAARQQSSWTAVSAEARPPTPPDQSRQAHPARPDIVPPGPSGPPLPFLPPSLATLTNATQGKHADEAVESLESFASLGPNPSIRCASQEPRPSLSAFKSASLSLKATGSLNTLSQLSSHPLSQRGSGPSTEQTTSGNWSSLARSPARSLLLLEQGSRVAVVIALHVLQVGLVTPLLRAYLQSSRVGWFVWSVFSVCVWFSPGLQREEGDRGVLWQERIGESLHEVEVRRIRE